MAYIHMQIKSFTKLSHFDSPHEAADRRPGNDFRNSGRAPYICFLLVDKVFGLFGGTSQLLMA